MSRIESDSLQIVQNPIYNANINREEFSPPSSPVHGSPFTLAAASSAFSPVEKKGGTLRKALQLTRQPSRETLVLTKEDERESTVQTVHNPIFGPRAAAAEFLLQPDFEVVHALCQVVVVPEEDRTVAEALVDFFEANGKTRKLMEWAILKEINHTASSSTLFRGSNEATKFMAVLNHKLCHDYLRQLVGPLVKDISSSGGSFEIDATRASLGVNVKDNLHKVLSITSEFLQHIFDSADKCPGFMRQILSFSKTEVSKKFPESNSIIVGVFFFSRFLIPAIVTPAQYGLSMEPLGVEAQRGLILISKLLQNLANGIEFEDNKKEYVPVLNNFLTENAGRLHKFFDKLAEHEDGADHLKSLYPVNSEIEQHAINTITSAMKENQQKIYSLLVKPDTKKTFIQLVEAHLFRPASPTNDEWKITPRKKSAEKMRLKALEERVDKLEKVELMYEEAVKAGKKTEKKLSELQQQLDEQKKTNEEQETRLAALEKKLQALLSATQPQ